MDYLNKYWLELLTLIIVLLGYTLIVYGLNKFGIFKKYNITLWGPIIMWRTKRGRKLIDRLSRRRTFWRWYGNFGIGICTLLMVFMFIITLIGGILAISIKTEPIPPQNTLVLPGINPIIPLWYGIIGLVVAIVLHEFTHGILARRIKLKLKSLGVLICVIPIGAFVEPDEKEMEKINRRDRARIFAGGLTTNIIIGLMFAAIFSWVFMASLEPVEDGVLIINVTEDFPAEEAGIEVGMVIIEVQGSTVNGSIIEKTNIESRSDFMEFMDARKVNETINITVFYEGKTKSINNISLADEYDITERDEDRGSGFLGVGGFGANEFKESLAHPVLSAGDNAARRRANVIQYVFTLPVPRNMEFKILPFHSPIIDAYEVTGPLAVLPTSLFWVLANIFYYLFWINILLGIFNALPAVPLDGGYVFKDVMHGILRRVKPSMDQKRREVFINKVTVSLAFFILLLLLFLLFGSYRFV
jgi:membrane-associated protease RseP (regulator of RpoE activity)